MTCDEVRNRMEPYADSELSANELAEFEPHLRDCASCAADALSLLQMKRMTRAAGVRYSPTPEFRLRMEQSIRAKSKAPLSAPWWRVRLPKLAMAVVAAAVVFVSAILWQGHAERDRAFTELADLHVAAMASTNPVDVISTDRHTVKPWFAGKLPFSFDLPELQNSEFKLVGGRVTYFQHESGAQLLFTVRKHQLSVFVFKRQSDGIPFALGTSVSTKLAFHLETWSEGGLRYFIVSDAPASDVHELSKLMRSAAH
jgi:anti-sigma factor RsiW